MIVVDDGRKVDNAKQIATRMVERDQVDVMTGIVWSNLAMAVIPGVTADDTIYISPNAGPSLLAGKRCHPNYFNVAWQNDNLHEAMGQYVSDQGYNNVYLMAPNYPAGKDVLAGFKRFYSGQIAGEVVTLMGRNGIGKTTTVRSIMGLNPVTGGDIGVDGQSIRTFKPYQVAQLGIGYVPEGRHVFPNLTVTENLMPPQRIGLVLMPHGLSKRFLICSQSSLCYATNTREPYLVVNNKCWLSGGH